MMVLIRFNLLLDFIEGLTVGLRIVFILTGMYCEKNDISKSKNYKKIIQTNYNKIILLINLKRDK